VQLFAAWIGPSREFENRVESAADQITRPRDRRSERSCSFSVYFVPHPFLKREWQVLLVPIVAPGRICARLSLSELLDLFRRRNPWPQLIAKCSVKTGPRIAVANMSTRTSFSTLTSSKRCPAELKVA